MPASISVHQALVYAMVIAAMADGKLKDSEIATIDEMTNILPAFKGHDHEAMLKSVRDCEKLLGQSDGLDVAIAQIKSALPERLRETAYAIACDVVAVDGSTPQEELRWLEMLRHDLSISRLNAAAIERGSRARYASL